MAKVAVYNMEGKEVDSIELNDSIFGVEINEHLVHMAVLQQLELGLLCQILLFRNVDSQNCCYRIGRTQPDDEENNKGDAKKHRYQQ